MGTKFSARLGMACEVATRTASIYSGIRQYSRILKNPFVPVSVKINIIRIYLITVGTFQCSTWPTLTKAQVGKFQTAILHVYRVATNQAFNPSKPQQRILSDVELLDTHELESPLALIRRARLQLLLRVKSKAPYVINMFINAIGTKYAPCSWIHAVQSDLNIVAALDHKLSIEHLSIGNVILSDTHTIS